MINNTLRILFSFSKTDSAIFISHLGMIEIFSAAMNRSSLPAVYTQGFNPLLKIDFASPAPVGLACIAEIACVDFESPLDPGLFVSKMNQTLPKGIIVTKAAMFDIPYGSKKYSPASLLWGFCYGDTNVPFREEKEYRLKVQQGKNIFGLIRNGMLAKNPENSEPEDYFGLYRKLYSGRQNNHYGQ